MNDARARISVAFEDTSFEDAEKKYRTNVLIITNLESRKKIEDFKGRNLPKTKEFDKVMTRIAGESLEEPYITANDSKRKLSERSLRRTATVITVETTKPCSPEEVGKWSAPHLKLSSSSNW